MSYWGYFGGLLVLLFVTLTISRRRQTALWLAVKQSPLLAPVVRAVAAGRNKRDCRWLETIRSTFQPRDVTGTHKLRLGNPDADGGYVIVDDGTDYDLLLSYGVCDDVSFELDFVSKYPNCCIHLFDHTIDDIPEHHDAFTFHQEGIANRKTSNLDTLQSHFTQFAATSNHIFLKMDVEGFEYESLLAAPVSALKRFRQIAIELHGVYPDNHKLSRLLTRLSPLFEVVHVHGNNCGGQTLVCGRQVPSLLEITLFNRQHASDFGLSTIQYPTILDQPNDPSKAEISHEFLLSSRAATIT